MKLNWKSLKNIKMVFNIRAVFRRLSIVQKFSVSVILLIFLIMIILSTLIIEHQRKTLKAEMDSSQKLIINNFAKDIVEPLMFLDPLRLDEHTNIISQTTECIYVMVINNEGLVVSNTNRRLLGQTMPILEGNKTYLSFIQQQGFFQNISELSVEEIAVPVKIGHEIIGMAVIGFSKERMETFISKNLKGLKNHIIVISALIMLLGILGSFGLARALTTPMKKLKDKMQCVQTGDLSVDDTGGNLPNCWEIMQCNEKECPAYGKKRCWSVTGTRCYGKIQQDVVEKISDCRKCIVYRESCGDEIGELVEAFNDMVIKLRNSIRELEEINIEKAHLEKLSAIGEMSMTVAHEIKNPLNAIKGAASYLKDNFKGEVLREFLSIIEEETNRLNDIVSSYLMFAKPAPLKLDISDLNKIIMETVNLIRQEATDSNKEVIARLDDNIPPFMMDAQQIKQALLNILVNSLDATEEGDTIEILSYILDGKINIVIRDTGSGISETIISDIFKPFYTTKTRGSGLGLACVDRIIKDHKGTISIKSEVGKETEFTIAFPLVRNERYNAK